MKSNEFLCYKAAAAAPLICIWRRYLQLFYVIIMFIAMFFEVFWLFMLAAWFIVIELECVDVTWFNLCDWKP